MPGLAGSEYTDLTMLPGGAGLLAATADARLMFLAPAPSSSEAGLGRGHRKQDTQQASDLVLTRHLIGNIDEARGCFCGASEPNLSLSLFCRSIYEPHSDFVFQGTSFPDR